VMFSFDWVVLGQRVFPHAPPVLAESASVSSAGTEL